MMSLLAEATLHEAVFSMKGVSGYYLPEANVLGLRACGRGGKTGTMSNFPYLVPLYGLASASIFAILILGEQLSLAIAIGTMAVVVGAVVAAWNPKGLKRTWPLWAIALPLGASLIRATGHIVTKYGLFEVDSPSFAVLVGNTVSLGTAALLYRSEGRSLSGASRGNSWFFAAGIANALSVQFLNNALAIGDVVAVVPIVS